jgi:hypothetical protein
MLSVPAGMLLAGMLLAGMLARAMLRARRAMRERPVVVLQRCRSRCRRSVSSFGS